MAKYCQQVATASALIIIIAITMISFVLAYTTMTIIMGDGKYKYIPKRLRWNRERVKRIYLKVRLRTRWKMYSIRLGMVYLVSTIGCAMGQSNKIYRNYVYENTGTRIDIPTIAHTTEKDIYAMVGTRIPHKATKKGPLKGRHRDIFDGDTYQILVDGGCSYCITNDMRHFVGTPKETNVSVKGIGGQMVQATFIGTVKWSYANDQGQIHDEYIRNTYYNEGSQYCLYSPQHVAQQANDHYPKRNGTFSISYDYYMELYWDQRSQIRTIPIHPKLNVFIMTSAPNPNSFSAFCSTVEQIDNYHTDMTSPSIQAFNSNVISDGESDDDSVGDQDNESITGIVRSTTDIGRRHPDLPNSAFDRMTSEPIKEPADKVHIIPNEDVEVQASTPQARLLAWHYRLGHLPFRKIQQLAKRGDLPAALSMCPIPKCAACLFGKATRRPWRTRAPVNAMSIPPVTAPGSVVSVDQMISAVPGLIPQMKGFITYKRYEVATIFVDHFSGLSFVHLQKGSTAGETIEAKHAFERYAKAHGVKIHHYHADNGIFEAREFQDAIVGDGQTISFCGVNAHHQNGRAEKKIRDLQELTRTMILHAQHRWPNAISAHLWPMAMKNANDNSNSAPSANTGISPIETFTQVQVAPRVKHSHTFGAPVYVLEERLQSQGGHIPKWDKRSNVGIYLGTSPRHSRKVALVLNIETGHVSPQFHVVIDDFFETLRPSAGNPVPKSKWQRITGLCNTRTLNQNRKPSAEASIPATENVFWMDTDVNEEINVVNEPSVTSVPDGQAENDHIVPMRPANSVETENGNEDTAQPVEASAEMPMPKVVTRAGRETRMTSRMAESLQQQHDGIVSMYVSWEVYHDESYGIQNEMEDPIAFAATSNPDVMYLDQAMKEPDRIEFEKAMIKEVTTHTDNQHWLIIEKTAVPNGVDILPAVWAMRRKRRITTGEVYKWKARLNVHGGKQVHGVNYWETYAPVIGWTTIRLYLVLALLNKRATRQIDFVLAYPQADIECDLYMEIPRGFVFNGNRKTHCLLLKKNLYGQKQAGRIWNEYLHQGLLARGFVQSEVDMCLYYHKQYKVNLLIYTDDGILTGENDCDIDKVIDLMKKPIDDHRAFDLTDEGKITDYLGVTVSQEADGTIKLSQPHLIQQIIDDIGFNERTTTKATPAQSTTRLHRDLHGEERREDWHYRSIIGKLNFLEKSTRPDIAYAVHQCARFCNDPKFSHENAVKRIVKYLIGTKNDGIYIRPNGHSFDCWVDADFVGNWDRVNADVDPSTAKSRTGFVITYGGCPLSWASKLQTDVALSTTEAEYTALSTSLREVIHLMQLVQEANTMGWVTYQGAPIVHCKVFEDNIGALVMAKLPKMRPRTKHLCTRMHHFRERVRDGSISLEHVDTEDQIADMLTKPQPDALFCKQKPILMCFPCQDEELNRVRACEIPSDKMYTDESILESGELVTSMPALQRGLMENQANLSKEELGIKLSLRAPKAEETPGIIDVSNQQRSRDGSENEMTNHKYVTVIRRRAKRDKCATKRNNQ
jgi:hypothetical protein